MKPAAELPLARTESFLGGLHPQAVSFLFLHLKKEKKKVI